jgi:hypothetical protein
MKRFEDLSEDKKRVAVHNALKDIVNGLMCGTVQIQLSKEMHHRVMMRTLVHGKENGDFTRFHRFVQKSTLFKTEVDDMANALAKKAYYTEEREYVIYGVA